MLDKVDINENEKKELLEIVITSPREEFPLGAKALNDCTELMNRTLSGAEEIVPADALGCWIVWNLFGRIELDNEEMKLITILGSYAI